MSTIGKNIRKIRTVKKLSQAAFAELFNLARPSVGAYEEERAEPKIETVIQIANHFGISIDSLLTKELTINELYKFDLHAQELIDSNEKEQANISSSIRSVFVSSSKQIEYIIQHQNKDFIAGLPRIFIPGMDDEKVRAFELSNEEMHDNFHGLNNGDILVGQKVKLEDANKLKDHFVYVFVLKEEIVIRRFTKYGKKIVLTADNPNFEPRELNQESFLEIWEVSGYFSRQLKPPSLLSDRVIYLENTVQKLEVRLNKIERKIKE